MKIRKFILAAAIILAVCEFSGCAYRAYDFTQEDRGFTGLSKQYEALGWLEDNPNEYASAGNRFEDSQDAKEFIQNLYDLGATQVFITGIFDEEWRIKEEGGPYADTLIVTLPADSDKREAIIKIYREEYEREYGEEATDLIGDTLYFWWD
jgi:hypothetical protein